LYGFTLCPLISRSWPLSQKHFLGQKIWALLQEYSTPGTHFTLVWVPGHAGLAGNEVADAEARRGGQDDQEEAAVDFSSAAKAALKEVARQRTKAKFEEDLPLDHHYRLASKGKRLPPDPLRSRAEEKTFGYSGWTGIRNA
jgi:hypothetical protein